MQKKYDGIFLRFLEKRDDDKVMFELHDGPIGRHYGGDTTAHKILKEKYYCPSLFKYSHAYTIKCQQCQTSVRRKKKVAFPLQHVIIERPFQ